MHYNMLICEVILYIITAVPRTFNPTESRSIAQLSRDVPFYLLVSSNFSASRRIKPALLKLLLNIGILASFSFTIAILCEFVLKLENCSNSVTCVENILCNCQET